MNSSTTTTEDKTMRYTTDQESLDIIAEYSRTIGVVAKATDARLERGLGASESDLMLLEEAIAAIRAQRRNRDLLAA